MKRRYEVKINRPDTAAEGKKLYDVVESYGDKITRSAFYITNKETFMNEQPPRYQLGLHCTFRFDDKVLAEEFCQKLEMANMVEEIKNV